jgi:hypothetical protein
MSPVASQKELVVLVADLDAENAIKGLLERSSALGIRGLGPEEFSIRIHPNRDSGCRGDFCNYLRSSLVNHRRALVMFDHHGSGSELKPAEHIEQEIEKELSMNGWQECCCIVLKPELECWIWSDSPVVVRELGWQGRTPSLLQWMTNEKHITPDDLKPFDPKTAFRAAIRKSGIRYSGRLFYNMAAKVSLNRCRDRAFLKLKSIMKDWFGQQENGQSQTQT